jgi:hypothetical protein
MQNLPTASAGPRKHFSDAARRGLMDRDHRAGAPACAFGN